MTADKLVAERRLAGRTYAGPHGQTRHQGTSGHHEPRTL